MSRPKTEGYVLVFVRISILTILVLCPQSAIVAAPSYESTKKWLEQFMKSQMPCVEWGRLSACLVTLKGRQGLCDVRTTQYTYQIDFSKMHRSNIWSGNLIIYFEHPTAMWRYTTKKIAPERTWISSPLAREWRKEEFPLSKIWPASVIRSC